MKYNSCEISLRAFGLDHKLKANSKKPFTMETAKKYVENLFGETGVVIEIKVGEEIIPNPDYVPNKKFEIDTTISDGLIKNK